MSVEYVLGVGVVCGIICAVIAGNKEQSSCSGCIGGFLFGIFGLIYWACAPDRRRERLERERHHEQMMMQQQILMQQTNARACPACGVSMPPAATFCSNCGSKLIAG